MSASSREEFEKLLRSIHGATSLDSDVNRPSVSEAAISRHLQRFHNK